MFTMAGPSGERQPEQGRTRAREARASEDIVIGGADAGQGPGGPGADGRAAQGQGGQSGFQTGDGAGAGGRIVDEDGAEKVASAAGVVHADPGRIAGGIR